MFNIASLVTRLDGSSKVIYVEIESTHVTSH